MGNGNVTLKDMIIGVEGAVPIPDGSTPQAILAWGNSIFRIEAHGYSMRNLGNLSGIPAFKMEQWLCGRLELMTDELKKLARVLEINIKVYEN
jgi:hypothetical protein